MTMVFYIMSAEPVNAVLWNDIELHIAIVLQARAYRLVPVCMYYRLAMISLSGFPSTPSSGNLTLELVRTDS